VRHLIKIMLIAALAVAASVVAVVPAQSAQRGVPVLGSARHYAPYAKGFGTAHPRKIDNGGVPNGIVFRIRWRHWGANRAIGRGMTYLYKPRGGYYRRAGRIVLRAQRLGSCGNGRPAYTLLKARTARRPRVPVSGPWRTWGSHLCRR